MTYNTAITTLQSFGVQARTAYNAVRKSSLRAQTVAPFGHTVNRPRQIIVDIDGNGGYKLQLVW